MAAVGTGATAAEIVGIGQGLESVMTARTRKSSITAAKMSQTALPMEGEPPITEFMRDLATKNEEEGDQRKSSTKNCYRRP